MNNQKYIICVIKGDGIGNEVISETLRLFKEIPLSLEFNEARAGYQCYLDSGVSLPDETIAMCKKASAILFGAVTTPPHIEGYQSPIITLRKKLQLFANVRPIISLPVLGNRQDIDFVLVRENTEGLYSGEEEEIEDGFVAKRIITKTASARIIRFAFELAEKQNRRLVTVVHKANILRKTDGLFLEIAEDISHDYPKISFEDMLVDNVSMRIIKQPEHFGVLVTTNMFGDILSDEASALVGGLGVVASSNIGNECALFEPVHGSSPKSAGKNTVNPLASFFAGVMMLEYLGETQVAANLRRSILTVIRNNCVTKDLGGQASTSEVTDTVIKVYRHRL